jgi:hypothetical protein
MELYDFFKENDLSSVRKTLVLRTGRMWQIRLAIKSLKYYAPDTSIDVLCQPSAIQEAAASPHVDRVIPYPAEKVLLRNTPLRLIRRIRAERYDLVLIVLNSEGTKGYENVYRVVSLFGAKRRCRYAANHEMWLYHPLFCMSPNLALAIAPLIIVIAGAVALPHLFFAAACTLSRKIFRLHPNLPLPPE